MTNDKLRLIFGRFQNLNLLCLLADLRNGNVARCCWVSMSESLCPLAHGWDTFCNFADGEDRDEDGIWCHEMGHAGISQREGELGDGFVSWWDAGTEDEELYSDKVIRLKRVLESLWQERQEDADAVQAVIAPVEEGVFA